VAFKAFNSQVHDSAWLTSASATKVTYGVGYHLLHHPSAISFTLYNTNIRVPKTISGHDLTLQVQILFDYN